MKTVLHFNPKPVILFLQLILLLSSRSAEAQTFTYASSGLTAGSCNIFDPPVGITASNSTSYTHTSLQGAQVFNGSSIEMLSYWTSSGSAYNTYAIAYPFQANYYYTIVANLTNSRAGSHGGTLLSFGLANSLPTASTGCSGSNYSSTPFTPFSTLGFFTEPTPADFNSNSTFVSSAQSYLLLGTSIDHFFGMASSQTNIYSVAITGVSTITGLDNICSAETYSVGTTGGTVTWTVSGASGVVSPAIVGNSITLTKLTEGKITLTATLLDPMGVGISVAKDIYVGVPVVSNIGTEFNMIHCNVVNYRYTAIGEGATTYDWYEKLIAGSFSSAYKSSADNWSTSPNNDQSCDLTNIQVIASNTCGSGTPFVVQSDRCPLFTAEDCTYGRFLTISPSPAQSTIQVKIKDDKESTEIKRGQHIVNLRIIDKGGRILKSIAGNQLSLMNLDISNLVKGDIYIVQVFDGKTWLTGRFLKN